MTEVAIIGDIHLAFSAEDVAYFNRSSYDLILFVGDLSNWSHVQGIRQARSLALLKKQALFIPGNHDTVTPPQLLAEIKGYSLVSRLTALGHGRRDMALQKSLAGIQYGGFSIHPFAGPDGRFEVIAGRPYSMGGPKLGYGSILRKRFGVNSIADAAELLKHQIDLSISDTLIFLAHNGPFGLGAARTDIWGNDFSASEGDHGDLDLKLAVDYALSSGKRVLAVLAGHMHHRLKDGGTREWHVERDGIHYVNAARVPRAFLRCGCKVRHHVRLFFDASHIRIQQMFVQ